MIIEKNDAGEWWLVEKRLSKRYNDHLIAIVIIIT